MMSKTLYRPKLESGTKATLWSPMSVYTSSLIKQTADSILLEVDDIVADSTSGLTQRVGRLEVTSSSITQSVSSLTNTVTGHTTQIGQLQVTASGIEGRVTDIETSISQPNLLPQNGWTDSDGNDVTPTNDMCYSATTTPIISPKIHLETGVYCISQYSNDKHFMLYLDDEIMTRTSTSSTTDTYKSLTRYYDVYTIATAGDYRCEIGLNSADIAFYRPKLETGNTPTAYEDGTIMYSSLIQQTSKEIKLQVEEQDAVGKFKRAGIDITSGRIVMQADNTDVVGNLGLHATNDADALTLYDDDNIARTTVTSHQIGALSSQSMDASKMYHKSGIWMHNESTIIEMGEAKYYPTDSVVKAGNDKGRIAYVVCDYLDANNNRQPRYITNPNKCKIELQLVNDNTTYTYPSIQQTYTSTTNVLIANVTDTTYAGLTITSGGYYKPIIKITWADGNNVSPFDSNTYYTAETYITSTSPSKTLIGPDGMYMTNGDSKYMYFGTDGLATVQSNDRGGKSSVGAVTSEWSSVFSTPDNKYVYTTNKTGPSHIASFAVGGEQWTNSQQYCNIQSLVKSTNYNSNYYIPYPSTDLIVVLDNGVDSTQRIHLGDLEYDGHVVMIKTMTEPIRVLFGSGSTTGFISPTGTKSGDYNKRIMYIKMVYVTMSDSSYSGYWLVLDEITQ